MDSSLDEIRHISTTTTTFTPPSYHPDPIIHPNPITAPATSSNYEKDRGIGSVWGGFVGSGGCKLRGVDRKADEVVEGYKGRRRGMKTRISCTPCSKFSSF